MAVTASTIKKLFDKLGETATVTRYDPETESYGEPETIDIIIEDSEFGFTRSAHWSRNEIGQPVPREQKRVRTKAPFNSFKDRLTIDGAQWAVTQASEQDSLLGLWLTGIRRQAKASA